MDVAMHVSNGIIDGPTSAVFGLIALAAIALCAVKARRELDERTVPLAGLVAAFIFAVQMLNFPVLAGVSGHLLGAALAVALVGPWTGALCIALVLLVQSLLFADGGVTALGLMVVNMAVVGGLVGYGLLRLLLKLLPRTPSGVTVAAAVGAWASVVAGAGAFVVQYAIGGATDLGEAAGSVAAAMLGVHALIGVGEAVITAATVLTVAKVRPDLVYALRGESLNLQTAVVGGKV